VFSRHFELALRQHVATRMNVTCEIFITFSVYKISVFILTSVRTDHCYTTALVEKLIVRNSDMKLLEVCRAVGNNVLDLNSHAWRGKVF